MNYRQLSVIAGVYVTALLLTGCVAPTTQSASVDRAAIEREAELQREIALETYLKYSQRLHRVAYPILKNGASLYNEKVRPHIGINYANKYSFPKDLRKASVSLFGLGERLKIISVTPGTPADDAGLQKGDILVAINKQRVPVGLNAQRGIMETLDRYTQSGGPLTITILRDSVLKELDVRPETICDYQVNLGESDNINAYADGKSITITRGMLRFVDDDTELALVIGHELAHNVMKHIDAKMKNYAVGSIFDILAAMYGVDTGGTFGGIAAGAYSKEFETEADYVGLYLLARADIEIENSAKFWRRMAAEHPGSINTNHASTHPATPERFIAIENTVKEIVAKRDAGKDLVPTYK